MSATPSTQTASRARAAAARRFADYIRLDDVPEAIKDLRTVHRMTVYSWARKGVSGARLEVRSVGCIKCTTLDWLEEFFEAINIAQLERIEARHKNKNLIAAGNVSATPPMGPRSLVGHKESPAVTSILKEFGI